MRNTNTCARHKDPLPAAAEAEIANFVLQFCTHRLFDFASSPKSLLQNDGDHTPTNRTRTLTSSRGEPLREGFCVCFTCVFLPGQSHPGIQQQVCYCARAMASSAFLSRKDRLPSSPHAKNLEWKERSPSKNKHRLIAALRSSVALAHRRKRFDRGNKRGKR